MWGFAPVIVFNGGSLQMGDFPNFASDGSGGAVYGWYDVAGVRNCYVQHVNEAGGEVFPHNGVAASTLGGRTRLSPGLAYNPTSGEIFLFWTETNRCRPNGDSTGRSSRRAVPGSGRTPAANFCRSAPTRTPSCRP